MLAEAALALADEPTFTTKTEILQEKTPTITTPTTTTTTDFMERTGFKLERAESSSAPVLDLASKEAPKKKRGRPVGLTKVKDLYFFNAIFQKMLFFSKFQRILVNQYINIFRFILQIFSIRCEQLYFSVH